MQVRKASIQNHCRAFLRSDASFKNKLFTISLLDTLLFECPVLLFVATVGFWNMVLVGDLAVLI